MNVYDKAHELARGLKESDEYRAYLAAKEALGPDAAAKKMVRDFLAKKMEVEYDALAGKAEDKAKMDQLQQLYGLLSYNAKAREFLEAYSRFQRMMGDVSKIIGDAVAEGLDIFAQE